MRPHRAFVDQLSSQMRLQGREARHLLEVLRARVGDTLTVFDGKGLEGKARVESVVGGQVELALLDSHPSSTETPHPITLYLALLKGDKLSDVVRAVTELGVAQIVPVVTQHCVVKELADNKLERLRRVALEAAKQCERSVVPSISEPIRLKQVPAVGQGFVAHPRVSARVSESFDPERPAAILTGPEGGLADTEVAFLEEQGFRAITLGPHILRAETAPVALLSLLTAAEGI